MREVTISTEACTVKIGHSFQFGNRQVLGRASNLLVAQKHLFFLIQDLFLTCSNASCR